ncbi:MAG: J domain-containing protein [Dehalogenimonas sp.]|jgi:DnaJ-class molecular chaperone|uniref:J domain-containing protein n=1 Tax=Candidatus Dehalogenimonas loeffleri TaxID=3127115 RepID=A0ABZ2J0Y8_9CHLR|nr:J domain-containing protein [Dehalogenimonas sp.]
MADFTTIDSARKTLGLSETATMSEIKGAYRHLSHLHHPDKTSGDDGEAMKKVNHAFKILMDYVESYRYSFDEGTVLRCDPYQDYLKRFYDGGF